MPAFGLPTLVHKRDGRVVPFEADNISQALYAATEALGQPSAFLARELTDGVLHFLAEEIGPEQPTTAQIGDLVEKVVRELGQPALAQVYAVGQRRRRPEVTGPPATPKADRSGTSVFFSNKDTPEAVVSRALCSYSMQAVFARDLAAAHEEGLVALAGLDRPEELARLVVEPTAGADGWLTLLDSPTRTLVFDGPEHALTDENVVPWLQGLEQFCAATKRNAILNLHVVQPPAWAAGNPEGPLFKYAPASADDPTRRAWLLLNASVAMPLVSVNWHLSDADFAPDQLAGLSELARLAWEGRGLTLTLDRANGRTVLAPGVDRRHAAALMDVYLDLPHFLRLAAVDNDARLFLDKLPSLARMAVRAGVQKRNFLRQRSLDHPALARAFRLERARLVVVPLGVDQVVASLLGQGMAASKLSLDLAHQAIEVLRLTFDKESDATNLEIALDGPDGELPGARGPGDSTLVNAAGILHGIAGFGTLHLTAPTTSSLVELLTYAMKKTALVALRQIPASQEDAPDPAGLTPAEARR